MDDEDRSIRWVKREHLEHWLKQWRTYYRTKELGGAMAANVQDPRLKYSMHQITMELSRRNNLDMFKNLREET